MPWPVVLLCLSAFAVLRKHIYHWLLCEFKLVLLKQKTDCQMDEQELNESLTKVSLLKGKVYMSWGWVLWGGFAMYSLITCIILQLFHSFLRSIHLWMLSNKSQLVVISIWITFCSLSAKALAFLYNCRILAAFTYQMSVSSKANVCLM